jgi:hypothetical protein
MLTPLIWMTSTYALVSPTRSPLRRISTVAVYAVFGSRPVTFPETISAAPLAAPLADLYTTWDTVGAGGCALHNSFAPREFVKNTSTKPSRSKSFHTPELENLEPFNAPEPGWRLKSLPATPPNDSTATAHHVHAKSASANWGGSLGVTTPPGEFTSLEASMWRSMWRAAIK